MADLNYAEDPVIFARNLEKAWNEQKYDEVMNYFAPDAIFELVPPRPGTTGIYSGTSEIGNIVGQMLLGYHADSTDFMTDGTTVSYISTVSSDMLRSLGAPTVDGTTQMTINGNQIETYTFTLSQESVAKLQGQGSTPQG